VDNRALLCSTLSLLKSIYWA